MKRSVSFLMIALFLLIVPAMVNADAHDPKRIMPAEVMEKLSAGEEVLFLDTRSSGDWKSATSMIQNAVRVKNDAHLTELMTQVPKEKLIVTYCT